MKPSILVERLTKEFQLAGGGRFRALDELSFAIEPGHVTGILGRNGAGKSTLLKVLARILPPTAGRVELRGRVGSLLEVGTGFHPELPGRDNIFLSAALLGMKDHEIRSQFDAIVDFSGVGDFIDQPVKHYSTGMYVRLAFAVAAYLEPEILLVDEVLAVGDADFQKKCMQRLDALGQHGQTVLFVSHNMQAIARLCDRALWIERGKLEMDGPVAEVTAAYLQHGSATPGERRWPDEGPHAPGDEVVRLRRVRVAGPDRETASSIDVGKPFTIEVDFDVESAGIVLFPMVRLYNEWGTEVVWSTDATVEDLHGKPRAAGRYEATVRVPANLLAEGMITVTVTIQSLRPKRIHVSEPETVYFQATDQLDGSTSRGQFTDYIGATTRPLLEWTTVVRPR